MASAHLDRGILSANVRAWKKHVGAAVRAVIKADGYGWGAARVIADIDAEVDGYCVADLTEFEAARRSTPKPIAILGDVVPDELARVLEAGGIPNASDAASIRAAAAWARERNTVARVRVGLRPAATWAGVDEERVANLAPLLADRVLEVECWTHLTDPSLYVAQRAAFARFVDRLRGAGVRIAGCDVDATASSATAPFAEATSARIGVGLFGSGASLVRGVRCAVSVRAAVVRVARAEGQLVGYGTARAPREGFLSVIRCGYANGFPRLLEPFAPIVAVGMQFAVVTSPEPPDGAFVDLVTSATDLDRLAAAARLAPHDVVVRLGHAARVSAGEEAAKQPPSGNPRAAEGTNRA